MSSGRSREAGQPEGPQVDARQQVLAEAPAAHRAAESRLVPAISWKSLSPPGREPTGRKRFSSIARSSIACSSSAELADLVEEQQAAVGLAQQARAIARSRR